MFSVRINTATANWWRTEKANCMKNVCGARPNQNRNGLVWKINYGRNVESPCLDTFHIWHAALSLCVSGPCCISDDNWCSGFIINFDDLIETHVAWLWRVLSNFVDNERVNSLWGYRKRATYLLIRSTFYMNKNCWLVIFDDESFERSVCWKVYSNVMK